MPNIPARVLKEVLQDFVILDELIAVDGAPAAGQFRSEIIGRAPIIDLIQDLKPRMGISRIMTQNIEQLQGEVGPNGEPVFKLAGEGSDQIRFVGDWFQENISEDGGPVIKSDTPGAFVEITFLGTGLNFLTRMSGDARDLRASVDGGAEGSDLNIEGSSVLTGRNYAPNSIMTVTSGLSFELHTIKLRFAAGVNFRFTGFEILTESTDLKVPKGNVVISGALVEHEAEETIDFDGAFTNVFGTPGVKGSHVLVYLDMDGNVKKDIQYTENAQLNLGNADHTNEEIIKKTNFKEFGAGRTDDFSTLESSSDRAFTLSDGTTILIGEDVSVFGNGINCAAANDFIIITFVGTGLDVVDSRIATVTTVVDAIVDGSSIGTFTPPGNNKVFKVVSGLPFGTHTVKLNNTNSATNAAYKDFIIYGPKEPSLPENTIKLNDYFLMADFVANTVGGIGTISAGVLRKSNVREFVYINGTGGSSWSLGSILSGALITGFEAITTHTASLFEYTFWGTGFDLRWRSNVDRTSDVDVTVDGLPLTVANFPSLVTTTYGDGGISYNNGTAKLDPSAGSVTLGNGFTAKGLTLAKHTVRFTNAEVAGNFFNFGTLDIITPIYSPKRNITSLQQEFEVGSQGLKDGRKLSALKENDEQPAKLAQAVGTSSGITTTSASFVPLPDMQLTIETTGKPVEIDFAGNFSHSGSVGMVYDIFVDGVIVPGGNAIGLIIGGGGTQQISKSVAIPLSAGFHQIQVLWKTSSGTMTSFNRKLTTQEIT